MVDHSGTIAELRVVATSSLSTLRTSALVQQTLKNEDLEERETKERVAQNDHWAILSGTSPINQPVISKLALQDLFLNFLSSLFFQPHYSVHSEE